MRGNSTISNRCRCHRTAAVDHRTSCRWRPPYAVEFISLKENIDTTTPQGRFMLTVFAALSELERESILERQREGIEIAKAEGKYKGRKPVTINETKFRAVCARWRAGEITATAAMKELDLKPNTFYRRSKEMGL